MKRHLVIGTLSLLFVTLPAWAESKCEITESLQACWQKYIQDKTATAKAQEKEEEQTDLVTTNTGTDTGGTTSASNVKNFLDLLSLSGLLDVEENEDSGVLTATYNFGLFNQDGENGGQLQLGADTKPDLYEPLRKALTDQKQDDALKKIEDGLGSSEDYKLTFTLNLLTDRFGRSFKRHATQYDALMGEVEKRFSEREQRMSPLPAFARAFLTSGSDDDGKGSDAAFDDPSIWSDSYTGGEARSFVELSQEKLGFTAPEDDSEEAIAAYKADLAANEAQIETLAVTMRDDFEAAADVEAKLEAAFVAEVKKYRLNQFAALLNNQPQLYVSAAWHSRDDLVGPDEKSLKVTWEKPQAPSLYSFNEHFERLYPRKTCQVAATDCLDELRTYVDTNADALKSSDRFSFSLEYMETDALTISLPDVLTEDLSIDAAEKLIVSAGWGRKFDAATRLDFTASWEDVSDDPNRQDRGIARLTVTKKMNGMDVPFGIVYATKSEYLDAEDVDEKLSAHVGIKFSLGGKKKSD